MTSAYVPEWQLLSYTSNQLGLLFFTPSQPVRLYQGEAMQQSRTELYTTYKNSRNTKICVWLSCG